MLGFVPQPNLHSFSEKLAKDIFDARCKKPKQEFEDYRDVVKSVKNLGDKTILTIIDEWSRS
jgi:predicted nucleic acid-binding OB-fold protein